MKTVNERREDMNYLDPWEMCTEEVITSLRTALKGLGYDERKLALEIPREDRGDLAFSCFSLAGVAKKAPQAIAQELAESLILGENIEKCASIGAYVNFYVNSKKLAEMTLKAVLESGHDYGNAPPKNRTIILEHTSANPTDKLHIGRARNPIIGDSLARILRKAGYEVETQYYVDDMGKQAVTLAYGIEIWDNRPKDDDSLGPYQYASKMVSDNPDMSAIRDEWLQKLEKGEPEITEKVRSACERVMEEDIIPSLARINVLIDKYVYESQFVQDGSVKTVIDALKGSEYCGIEEGAYYIDLERFGEKGRNTKFFFERSDGTSLYATRDIAYHQWKFAHCDDVINILGEDHKLESKQVRIGLKIIGETKAPEVIFYSFVSLPEGRMSTRKGQVVFVDELIKEALDRAEGEIEQRRKDLTKESMLKIAETVSIGAIRYNIVSVQPEKKMIFRWEDALNFEGNSAPFIQYAHARACSILRKAEELGFGGNDTYDPTLLIHASEVSLIKEMARFPGTVKECAKRRRPHAMASYAYNLASMFNQFYRDCPVLSGEDGSLRCSRLALVDGVSKVLKNALFCLGIEAPEEM